MALFEGQHREEYTLSHHIRYSVFAITFSFYNPILYMVSTGFRCSSEYGQPDWIGFSSSAAWIRCQCKSYCIFNKIHKSNVDKAIRVDRKLMELNGCQWCKWQGKLWAHGVRFFDCAFGNLRIDDCECLEMSVFKQCSLDWKQFVC